MAEVVDMQMRVAGAWHLCNALATASVAVDTFADVAAWDVEWLVRAEGGEREVPGFEFLLRIHPSARTHLVDLVEALRLTGPDRWADTTSHAPMHGTLDFCHEFRDRHAQTLYRLFVVWLRDERRMVIVDGRDKPNGTAIPDAEYETIAAFARTVVDGTYQAATEHDFATASLKLADVVAELRDEVAVRDELLGER